MIKPLLIFTGVDEIIYYKTNTYMFSNRDNLETYGLNQPIGGTFNTSHWSKYFTDLGA